jgi:thioredoxin-related protein
MKFCSFLMITVFTFVFLITPASAANADHLPKYSKVYDEKSDPFQDANAAIKLAKETQRNVLIEIGGNWCGWCKKMDAFLAKNPEVYQKLHDEFVLLKVSVSDSNENEAFMKSLPPVLGYPHMYVSTSSGKMILSKDTAELLSGEEYSKKQWLAFLNKWQSRAVKG